MKSPTKLKSMSGESLLNLFLVAILLVTGSVAVVVLDSAAVTVLWGVSLVAWAVRTIVQLSRDKARARSRSKEA